MSIVLTVIATLTVVFLGIYGYLYYLSRKVKAIINKAKESRNQTKKIMNQALKDDLNSMSPEQRVLADKALKLQNELLTVFTGYLKEIRGLKGDEMAAVAQMWIDTTEGLNKTIQTSFQYPSENKIKEHIEALETELNMAVLTNQEVLGTNNNFGGFGYRGPKGEA